MLGGTSQRSWLCCFGDTLPESDGVRERRDESAGRNVSDDDARRPSPWSALGFAAIRGEVGNGRCGLRRESRTRNCVW